MIDLRDFEGGIVGIIGGFALVVALLIFALFCFVGAYTVGTWIWSLA